MLSSICTCYVRRRTGTRSFERNVQSCNRLILYEALVVLVSCFLFCVLVLLHSSSWAYLISFDTNDRSFFHKILSFFVFAAPVPRIFIAIRRRSHIFYNMPSSFNPQSDHGSLVIRLRRPKMVALTNSNGRDFL